MFSRLAWLCAVAIAIAAGAGVVAADDTNPDQDTRPWLGISYDGRISAGSFGLPVTNVFEESAAIACGLRTGDEIVEVDGQPVGPGTDLSPIIMPHAIGDKLTIRVFRDNRIVTMHPVLTRRVNDSELLHRQLVGKRAPSFTLIRADDPDATPIDDSILVGKVGIVVWFHPSCSTCPALINELAPWIEAHDRDGVVGVAGTTGDVAALKAILTSNAISLPVGIDEDAWLHYGILEDFQDKIAISVVDGKGVIRMAAAVGVDDDGALDDVFAAADRAIRQRKQRR